MTSEKYDQPDPTEEQEKLTGPESIEVVGAPQPLETVGNKFDPRNEFPLWLDQELVKLEEKYEGFATCISNRYYFGR